MEQFGAALAALGKEFEEQVHLLAAHMAELDSLEFNPIHAAWPEAEICKVFVQALITRSLPGGEKIVVVRIKPLDKRLVPPFVKAFVRQQPSMAGGQAVEQLMELATTREPWSFRGICDLLEVVQTGLEYKDMEELLDELEELDEPVQPSTIGPVTMTGAVMGGICNLRGFETATISIPPIDMSKATLTVKSLTGYVYGTFLNITTLALINPTSADQQVQWRITV